jgi:hypothetical protein
MTKQHFIALADTIRAAGTFTPAQIEALAEFCEFQSPRFDRQRWLDYIAGTHGPNGGKK